MSASSASVVTSPSVQKPLTALGKDELHNRYTAEQSAQAQASKELLLKARSKLWEGVLEWAYLERLQKVLALQIEILEFKQNHLKDFDEANAKADYLKRLEHLHKEFIEGYKTLLSGQLLGFAKNIPQAEVPSLTEKEQKILLDYFLTEAFPQEMAEYRAFKPLSHAYLSHALETLRTRVVVTVRDQAACDKAQEANLKAWSRSKAREREREIVYEKIYEAEKNSIYALAEQGNLAEVRKLVETHKKKEGRSFYLAQKDAGGYTALHRACLAKQLAVIDYLLQEGADFRLCDDKYGYPAMHFALRQEGPDTLELLECFQKHKVPIDLLSRGEETPLHIAARYNNLQAARWLLQETPELLNKVSAKSRHKRTALHLAASEGHSLMVRFLLAQGADPRLLNSGGETALFEAVYKNYPFTAEVFVEEGIWLSQAEQAQLKRLMKTNPSGMKACSNLLEGLLTGEIERLDPSLSEKKTAVEALLLDDSKEREESEVLLIERKKLGEALEAASVLRTSLIVCSPATEPEAWVDAFLNQNASKIESPLEPWSLVAKNQGLTDLAIEFQAREHQEAELQEEQLLSALIESEGKRKYEQTELSTQTFSRMLLDKHQALKKIRLPFSKKPDELRDIEKIDLFRMLFDMKLSDLYLKCLSISKGLADLPKDKTQKMVQLLGLGGRFIPIPYASLFVSGITEAANHLLKKRGKNRLKSFLSDSPIADLHSASQVVNTIVEVFTHRHQHQIKALKSTSIELLVDGLLHRMFLYKRNPDKDYFAHLSLSLKDQPDLLEALHLARGSSQTYSSMLEGPSVEVARSLINQFTHNPLVVICLPKTRKVVSVEALCAETRIVTEMMKEEVPKIVFCQYSVLPTLREVPPLCIQPLEASLRKLKPIVYEEWPKPQFELHQKAERPVSPPPLSPLSQAEMANLTRTQSLPTVLAKK